jgi:hypothetical protein
VDLWHFGTDPDPDPAFYVSGWQDPNNNKFKNFFAHYFLKVHSFFKGLMAGCHSFYLFWFFITYIHSFNHNTFIRRHSLKPLSISSSPVCSVGETSLWGRAENRTRDCLTASRRAANWATPPHLTEPRRPIQLSHAAPYWATPPHSEPRRPKVHSYQFS